MWLHATAQQLRFCAAILQQRQTIPALISGNKPINKTCSKQRTQAPHVLIIEKSFMLLAFYGFFIKRRLVVFCLLGITSMLLSYGAFAQDNSPIDFDSPKVIQQTPSTPTPPPQTSPAQTPSSDSSQASTDQDVQAASKLGDVLDQAPSNVINGGAKGFIAGAALLIAAEVFSGGTVTIPLAIAVLSSGTCVGALLGTSDNVDNLNTVLDSVSTELDQ